MREDGLVDPRGSRHAGPIAVVADRGVRAVPSAPALVRRLLAEGEWAVAAATGAWRTTAELRLREAGIGIGPACIATASEDRARRDIVELAIERAAAMLRPGGRFAAVEFGRLERWGPGRRPMIRWLAWHHCRVDRDYAAEMRRHLDDVRLIRRRGGYNILLTGRKPASEPRPAPKPRCVSEPRP